MKRNPNEVNAINPNINANLRSLLLCFSTNKSDSSLTGSIFGFGMALAANCGSPSRLFSLASKGIRSITASGAL